MNRQLDKHRTRIIGCEGDAGAPQPLITITSGGLARMATSRNTMIADVRCNCDGRLECGECAADRSGQYLDLLA